MHLIDEYLDSWVKKRIDYELQAKNKAKINNEGWRKLRNYHLKDYVRKLDNPFAFMFHLKYRYKHLFKQVACANTVYNVVLDKRQEAMGVAPKKSNEKVRSNQ